VTSPSGKDFTRQFDVPEDEFAQLDADKRIYWGKSGDNVPAIKIFVNEPREITPYSVLLSKGTTSEGTGELADLFGDEELATQMRPKPVKLLKTLVQVATGESALVLDFFAGTGTTAQAVLELNELDGGRRRFILVQLPEPTAREDYPTVADITKERARRVIAKLDDKEAGQLNLEGRQREDRGFRVFILAESNFTPWNADVAHEAGALEAQLELHIDHIRGGRTRPDLLVEILLKSGFELSTAVERLDVAGTPVYSVAGGALLVCLELELTLDLIRAIALLKPERVVCLDEGFAGNDQLKANAVQIFKTQGVTTFRTV
jgi:adenine-specific DNA-methyltransferase